MKLKLKRIIFFVLIIINCTTIFYFSNEHGEKSSNTSGRVVDLICKIIPQINEMEEPQKTEFKQNVMQPIIRKLAHFSIYALLAIFTMNFALTYNGTLYQKSLCTLLFGFLYASSDEIHQLTTSGRCGSITDVLIDTMGVLTGIILVRIVHKIIKKVSKKQIEKQKIQANTKIMFISSTGGHFSELMQLKPLFDECNYHIVTEKTKSNENLKEKYEKKIDYLIYGTKKTPLKYIFVLLTNCFISLFIYLKFRPRVVITTGTHTAAPMCCIAKILGSKVIYIETFANRTTKTQAGKLLYYIADTFIIQWDQMQELYPKAKNFGWIY